MTQSVAIVHCHYEPGGVTQVVQNHVECLPPEVRCLLISGPRVSGLREAVSQIATSIVLPELEYDAKRTDAIQTVPLAQRADQLFESISEALRRQGETPARCVIHWHNHSLGKNAAAPIAIEQLAKSGWKILLQIHDFAEDQRPGNYRHLIEQTGHEDSNSIDQFLYPTHPNINYAVLTAGDAASLREFGIASQKTQIIPNSVRLPKTDVTDRSQAMRKVCQAFQLDAETRWVLYPVRGIRRKNIGEFLLVCQLLHRIDKRFVGGLTLRPDTPVESASYDRWKLVASEHITNLVFDAGQHPDISFTDNLAACHCVVSTSVAEGFGMAFLEPWVAGRRVVARNLPGVTSDFAQQGVRLNDLYDAFWIPGERDWIIAMTKAWSHQREHAWQTIPTTLRPISVDGNHASQPHDRIDFARLSPDDQVGVIARLSKDDGFSDSVIKANQHLLDAITKEADPSITNHNRHTIASAYNADAQREQLLAAYQFPGNSTSRESTNHRMIDLIDRVHPFYPCRVEEITSEPATSPQQSRSI